MGTARTTLFARGVAATSLGLILGSGAIAPVVATAAPATEPTGRSAVDQHSVTPTAVRNVTTLAEDGSILVSWEPPVNADAAPVSNYEVTVTSKAGYKQNGYTDNLSMSLWGLENGTEYTVSVRAISFPNVGPSTAVTAVPAPLPPKKQLTSTTTVSATTTGAVTRVSGTVMASDGTTTTPATGWVRATWTEPDGRSAGVLMQLDEQGRFSEQYEEGYTTGRAIEAVYLGDTTKTTQIAGSSVTATMHHQPDPIFFPPNGQPSTVSTSRVAAPETKAKPKAAMKVKPVSNKSKLHVDVNPNVGQKSWKLKVQKQAADGSWKTVKTTSTQGSKETRTVNLPKGTYRVVVAEGHGHSTTMSAPVTLKR